MCVITLFFPQCVVDGGPDCLQELVFTLLLVLCPSDKSPITASEDAADTFLETWQPALTVVCGDQATAAIPSLTGHIL